MRYVDFYSADKWNAAASQAAELALEHRFENHWGVFQWVIPGTYVAFVNRGNASTSGRQFLARLQDRLADSLWIDLLCTEDSLIHELPVRVRGIGQSSDGYTAAMILTVSRSDSGLPGDIPDVLLELEQEICRTAGELFNGTYVAAQVNAHAEA